MGKHHSNTPGRDANGNVDPNAWAGKHEAPEGKHEGPKSGGSGGTKSSK